MHEMAYAEGVLGVALDVTDEQPVRRIQLRIGALHGIVLDSLQFCFQLAAQDTPAADAELLLETVPVRVRCAACQAEAEVALPPPFQCPTCGTFDVAIVQGEEVIVDAIEVDSGWIQRPDAALFESAARTHLEEHAHAGGEL